MARSAVVHFGAPLATGRSYAHLDPRPFAGFANRVGDPIPLEVPTAGAGDFRVPALAVEGPDGSGVLALAYAGHSIGPGKPSIPGLPATYVESDDEADTVEIRLVDDPTGLEVTARLQHHGRPAGRDPVAPGPERGRRPGPADLGDEREPGPARRRLGSPHPERRMGP